MFWLRNKKNNFQYAFLSGGLVPVYLIINIIENLIFIVHVIKLKCASLKFYYLNPCEAKYYYYHSCKCTLFLRGSNLASANLLNGVNANSFSKKAS